MTARTHRHSLVLAFVVASMLTGCGSSPPSVPEIAAEVHRYVPAGWTVSTSNNMIRMRSDYEVALIGRLARPDFRPIEELATNSNRRTKYEMTMTFVPLLTTNQYLDLKAKRAPFLYTLEHGARLDGPVDGKTLYGQAISGYATNRVPMFFTRDYSIFVDRPFDRLVETYPSNALVQAEAMLTSFRRLFRRYDE